METKGIPSMQGCRYACMQVCKYASMQVCKYASIQVYKYASMQVSRFANMQIYKWTSMQVRKYAIMKDWYIIQICQVLPQLEIEHQQRGCSHGCLGLQGYQVHHRVQPKDDWGHIRAFTLDHLSMETKSCSRWVWIPPSSWQWLVENPSSQ